MPKYCATLEIPPAIDMGRFNGLASFLFLHDKYRYPKELVLQLTKEEEERVNTVIDTTTHVTTSYVSSETIGDDSVAEFSDLDFNLFDEGE
jgi:hypothetical protein